MIKEKINLLLKRLLPRPVLIICFGNLFTLISFFSIIPILAVLLTKIKGYSVAEVATATFVFTVSHKGGKFLIGPLLDKIHPKTCLIFGVLTSGVSFITVGLTDSYSMLIIFLIFGGLGLSVNSLSIKTSVSYIGRSDGNDYLYFSFLNIFVNIGSAIGPLIGSYFLSQNIAHYLFFTSGFLFTLSSCMFFLLIKKKDIAKNRGNAKRTALLGGYKFVLKDRRYITFLFVNMVGWFFYAQLFVSFSYYVSVRYNMEKFLGIMYTLNGLLIIFAQLPVSSFILHKMQKYNDYCRFSLSYLIFSLSFLSIALFDHFYLLIISIVLFTLAEIIFTPSVDYLVSSIADDRYRNTYFSILGLSVAIGEGSGNYIGLRLLEFWGNVGNYKWFWVSVSLFAFLVALYLFRVTLKRPKDT